MFPENGGYVVWVSSALGPFWGFQLGWMKWLSGVMDNALYPVSFLDYFKSAIPIIGNGFPRIIAVLVLTLVLTYMNYRGLTIVGWAAISLGVFSLIPLVVMGVISIPRIKPKRWVMMDLKNVNTLFWNLNYWDSAVAEMSSDSFQLLGMAERGMFPEFFGKRLSFVYSFS
ncbi:unnamed protein product [Vicia faba]|uniref:Uncharacterized protein n=1 Tax=Vicia faba TaxID=3906 RepID=A0AAV0ZV02_VICFA|nr:unnamed protein product [Vicia faba]